MIDPSNILIGSLLSFAVSQLKRISFVKKYPKVVTAVLSAAIPASLSIYSAASGHDLSNIADLSIQTATIFTSAVATHEAITEPLNKLG